VIYNANFRCLWSYDTLPARLSAIALWTTGRLYLDPFESLIRGTPDYWYHRTPGGHLVSRYSPVVPLLVSPLFLPAAVYAASRGIDGAEFTTMSEASEKVAASVVASLSVVAVYFLLRRFASPANAALLVLAYAFGTETWVIGSQALWQHGMSELLLALLLLALGGRKPAALVLAGIAAGLLVANRLPNAFFAAAAVGYVLAHRRERMLAFAVLPAAICAVMLVYNLAFFRDGFGGYSSDGVLYLQRLVHGSDRFAGVLGLLVSPGRGLLVFSPFLIFLAASQRAPATAELSRLLAFFVPAAGLQLLFYGTFYGWVGGHSYGPRLLADLTPVLILGLVPAIEALGHGTARRLFVGLLAFAIAVQAIGAFCYPSGGSNWKLDVWRLDNLQYWMELRGGLAPTSVPRFFSTEKHASIDRVGGTRQVAIAGAELEEKRNA
jgi:hypothetical protein